MTCRTFQNATQGLQPPLTGFSLAGQMLHKKERALPPSLVFAG